MAEKDLSEMSLDELRTREKSVKLAMRLFGGILILLAAVGVYMAFSKKGSVVFTILPVAFLPLLLGMSAQLKKIRSEIASRNS